MTADNLRKRKGNLTKRMDALFPQENPDSCRVCGEPVVDGRWNYCSERCRRIANAVQRMFIWDEVRERVLERDDYTCQHCGLSRALARRAYWQVNERIEEETDHLHPRRSDHPAADWDRWRRAKSELWERYGRIDFNAFQVDHIQPVSEGGHPFDETNLQTLCEECHHRKTAEENANPDTDLEQDSDDSDDSDDRPEVPLEEYILS